jgi:hypothetical protein
MLQPPVLSQQQALQRPRPSCQPAAAAAAAGAEAAAGRRRVVAGGGRVAVVHGAKADRLQDPHLLLELVDLGLRRPQRQLLLQPGRLLADRLQLIPQRVGLPLPCRDRLRWYMHTVCIGSAHHDIMTS